MKKMELFIWQDSYQISHISLTQNCINIKIQSNVVHLLYLTSNRMEFERATKDSILYS